MKIKKFKDWKESTKVFLFRIWLAGAVSLFVAWTPIGGGESSSPYFVYQMIFILALVLFLTNVIIMGPVKRMMFNLPDKNRYDNHLVKRIVGNLLHFFAMVAIVILIWLSYVGINTLLEQFNIYGENGTPFIMFEPFSFAILYGLYFAIGEKILHKMLGIKPLVVIPKQEEKE